MTSIINKVLLVEDEVDSRKLVVRLLTHYGINVIEAGTGEEALGKAQDVTPSLIIIDLALPGMDGWTLFSKLKAMPKFANTPFVAITAYHTAELASEAIKTGFNAYFAKPFNVTTFVRELEDVVRV